MAKFETRDKVLYIDDHKVLRAWESFSGWFWFGFEVARTQDSVIDGQVYENDKIYFGFVQGLEEEFGYFSVAEIQSLGWKAWEIPQPAITYSGRR